LVFMRSVRKNAAQFSENAKSIVQPDLPCYEMVFATVAPRSQPPYSPGAFFEPGRVMSEIEVISVGALFDAVQQRLELAWITDPEFGQLGKIEPPEASFRRPTLVGYLNLIHWH
jgi:hypothetical protein